MHNYERPDNDQIPNQSSVIFQCDEKCSMLHASWFQTTCNYKDKYAQKCSHNLFQHVSFLSYRVDSIFEFTLQGIVIDEHSVSGHIFFIIFSRLVIVN